MLLLPSPQTPLPGGEGLYGIPLPKGEGLYLIPVSKGEGLYPLQREMALRRRAEEGAPTPGRQLAEHAEPPRDRGREEARGRGREGARDRGREGARGRRRLRLPVLATTLLAWISLASLAGAGVVHAADAGEAEAVAEGAGTEATSAASEDAAAGEPPVPPIQPPEDGAVESTTTAPEDGATAEDAVEGATTGGSVAQGSVARTSATEGATVESATATASKDSATAEGVAEGTTPEADTAEDSATEQSTSTEADAPQATAAESATAQSTAPVPEDSTSAEGAAAAADGAEDSAAEQSTGAEADAPQSAGADGSAGAGAGAESAAPEADGTESVAAEDAAAATETNTPSVSAAEGATAEGSATESATAQSTAPSPEGAATAEGATEGTTPEDGAAEQSTGAEAAPPPPAEPPAVVEISVPELPAAGEPIKPIPEETGTSADKVALGRALFHDPRLSKDDSTACVSCHDLASGGDDGRRVSIGIEDREGPINAPTVFNVGLNFKQFWDGRANTLMQQVDGPVQNPLELGSLWPEVLSKLHAHESYPKRFNALYPDGINRNNVKDALAEFMRSLTTPNSRFDQWLRGDGDALEAQEKRGYALFKHYGCVSCHQGANVGGNMFQVFGVINEYFKKRGNITDADFGRYNVTGNPADRHVFKVPSLRMAAHTAPYLHDGSAETLRDAVDAMFEFQLGREAPDEHKDDIVAFIKTLAGENKELFQ